MDRKTYFITAAAVTGVVLAGTTAVAANIGILNAADDNNVGDLTAAAVVVTPPESVPTTVEPQVVDIFIDDPASTTLPAEEESESLAQQFKVDEAGSVTIKRTAVGILLDGVLANEGWEWRSAQPSPTEIVVTFTSGESEFVFYAGIAEDGSITARVDEPIVNVVQLPAQPVASSPPVSAAPATIPSGGGEDDHYEDDEDDHYEDEDDHEEDEEDEDDEEDEYEGRDDDD